MFTVGYMVLGVNVVGLDFASVEPELDRSHSSKIKYIYYSKYKPNKTCLPSLTQKRSDKAIVMELFNLGFADIL